MFRIKKIDKLIAKKFLPSFLAAFGIALFVLIMQVLWLYIDEIVGKGASIFMILEMFFYLSVTMVPQALPLGVLVASVMVLGGMGENYELSSMKSAGMSLWRVMVPLMVLSFLISVFSFYTSNTFMPMAKLKFQSRMYDIRKQQPVFAIEEGIFNNKFKDMTIHIEEKGLDNESIFGVKIYKNENSPKAKLSLVTAEEGKMYAINGGKHMVLQLFNGVQYEEEGMEKKSKYPFKITRFKSWKTVFDMSQFGMTHTDDKLWKSHYNVLNISQLSLHIDTIEMKKATADISYFKDLKSGIGFRSEKQDTTKQDAKMNKKIKNRKDNKKEKIGKKNYLTQIDSIQFECVPFIETFSTEKHKNIRAKAVSIAKNAKSIMKRQRDNNKVLATKINKYTYAMHSKFGSAIICFIFLFIGAPLGAIVRKGGFGFPILISIMFFMLYYIVQLFFKKTMETGVVSASLAIWYPVLIMSLIGLLISFAAVINVKLSLPDFSSIFKSKDDED